MLPKLGVFADFSHHCPIAKYATFVSEGMQSYFSIEQLDLQTSKLIHVDSIYPDYDTYFSGLLDRVDELDIVEIHLEFGLYGRTYEDVMKRILSILARAKRIVINVHSCHMDGGGFQKFYQDLFWHIKQQSNDKPILVIVNNSTDARTMESFGVKYIKFPIVYFTQSRITSLVSEDTLRNKSHAIHRKLHFKINKDDIILGAFGFINPIKDYVTVIKALAILPAHYKLIIAGSQDHRGKKTMQKDETVMEIVNTIAEIDSNINDQDVKLMDRIAFLDHLSDEEFLGIQSSVNFIVAPYLETAMSASSVMAQSLQLGRRVIGSICTTFDNLSEFYPDCFEQIDFGNYYQLRNKILAFDPAKMNNLQRCSKQWTVERLSNIYITFYKESLSFAPKQAEGNSQINQCINSVMWQERCKNFLLSMEAVKRLGKLLKRLCL